MRQRVRLNASRKNGFVVAVSTRALEVGSLIKSLSGFDTSVGIGTQRIGSRVRVSWNDVTTLTVSVAQTV